MTKSIRWQLFLLTGDLPLIQNVKRCNFLPHGGIQWYTRASQMHFMSDITVTQLLYETRQNNSWVTGKDSTVTLISNMCLWYCEPGDITFRAALGIHEMGLLKETKHIKIWNYLHAFINCDLVTPLAEVNFKWLEIINHLGVANEISRNS